MKHFEQLYFDSWTLQIWQVPRERERGGMFGSHVKGV